MSWHRQFLTRLTSLQLSRLGLKTVSSFLATWVGISSAVIGGFIGLHTYQQDVDKSVDESVAKTFSLVEKFNEPNMVAARARVLSYVYAKRACDARKIMRELNNNDFILVLDYFDLVHACVEAKLCDASTANRFFAPYANYEWPVLKTIVAKFRAEPQSLRADTGFGNGMKAFAKKPVDVKACDGNF